MRRVTSFCTTILLVPFCFHTIKLSPAAETAAQLLWCTADALFTVVGSGLASDMLYRIEEQRKTNEIARQCIAYQREQQNYATNVTTHVGNTNASVSTDGGAIFNFIKALGDWLCGPDGDDAREEARMRKEREYVSIQKSSAEKEAIHRWSLRLLKERLAQEIPGWGDEWLDRREEILLSWKQIQEEAIAQYNVHIAAATTLARKEKLLEAKRSAEQYIATFDVALALIQQEKEKRQQKRNNDAIMNSCASPGGKDPRDKDKNERYNGPKYASMSEIFEKAEIGKRLQANSERIQGEKYKGAQVYRVTKDMPEFCMYENDTFYLDIYHGEHIEVFKRSGSPRNVLSVDGRSLVDKLRKAIDSGRSYVPTRG